MSGRRSRAAALALPLVATGVVLLHPAPALADGLGPGLGSILLVMFLAACALAFVVAGGLVLLVWWLLRRRKARGGRA